MTKMLVTLKVNRKIQRYIKAEKCIMNLNVTISQLEQLSTFCHSFLCFHYVNFCLSILKKTVDIVFSPHKAQYACLKNIDIFLHNHMLSLQLTKLTVFPISVVRCQFIVKNILDCVFLQFLIESRFRQGLHITFSCYCCLF